MSDAIRYSSPPFDCPNAAELPAFSAGITGGTVTMAGEQWATPVCRDGIDFQTVADHTPPTWPDGSSPTQMHLDFTVDDLVATEAKVPSAGATRYAFQPNADHCLVFADPAGPFCLSTWATSPSEPQPHGQVVMDGSGSPAV